MEECFNCGADETKVLLFDAISKEGIVKVCNRCASKENIPIIKRKGGGVKEEKKESVSDRLLRAGGRERGIRKSGELRGQENSLRAIIDKNFKPISRPEAPNDLIDNFHWIILRARRLSKLTQRQFAEKIHEPEEAVKMAEKGILPADYRRLIGKIENFFDVRLLKREQILSPMVQSRTSSVIIPAREIDNFPMNSFAMKDLTIDDLKKMKKKKEEEKLEKLEGDEEESFFGDEDEEK